MSRLALILLLLESAAALTLPPASTATTPQATNQSPSEPANASPQAPANLSPAAPNIDPAAAIFTKSATAGLVLVTVKPDKVADYEDVIRTLQDALSRSTEPRQQALAKGWRVFKSATDPKANAIYIHLIDPVVPDTDYRPSLVLDAILAGASAEMLAKYRDAIVGAPAMLGMNELANMAVAPPPKPANGSPGAPLPPTNGSPDAPPPLKEPG